MDVRCVLVHENVDRIAFEKASRRDNVAIFYDPIGGLPMGSISEEEFDRRAFWVAPGKVLRLAELIEAHTPPHQILDTLSLYSRSRESVLREFETKDRSLDPEPLRKPARTPIPRIPLIRKDGRIADVEGDFPSVSLGPDPDTRLKVRRTPLVHQGISGCEPDDDDY